MHGESSVFTFLLLLYGLQNETSKVYIFFFAYKCDKVQNKIRNKSTHNNAEINKRQSTVQTEEEEDWEDSHAVVICTNGLEIKHRATIEKGNVTPLRFQF
jgi:hypothetical protein